MIHETLLTSMTDYERRFREPAPSLHETWLATMPEARKRSRRRRAGSALLGSLIAVSAIWLGAGSIDAQAAGELIALASSVTTIWC